MGHLAKDSPDVNKTRYATPALRNVVSLSTITDKMAKICINDNLLNIKWQKPNFDFAAKHCATVAIEVNTPLDGMIQQKAFTYD